MWKSSLFLLLLGPAIVPREVLADLATDASGPLTGAWWVWPAGFFAVSVGIGILSVLGGVGGGLLYLALITAFSSVHLDYIRVIALLLTLTGGLIASPGLLRRDFASLRLALPLSLLSAGGAILGAQIGSRLSVATLNLGLGIAILLSALYFSFQRNIRRPPGVAVDRLSTVLGFSGVYWEESTHQRTAWAVHRALPALPLFFIAGVVTGALGLETGWASVGLLNLMMGAPLKIAVGTGKFLGIFTSGSAAWVYFNHGCFVPLLAVPSLLGVITGSFAAIEMHSLVVSRIKIFRVAAISLLILCGIRIFMRGLQP